jgi:effector-binding domain-containing protein
MGDIDTSFWLTETEIGTTVLWRYENDFGRNIFGRYYGLLLGGIVGADFEEGLASLKAMAESLPSADFSDLQVEQIVVTAADIAYMETSSEPLAAAISEAMGNAYFAVLNFMDRHGLQEAGAPLSISRAFDGSELRFDAGIPVRGITDTTPRVQDSVRLGRTYGGAVIRVIHRGSYLRLGQTHNKIAAYLAALGISRNGDAWESYVSDPTRTDESELITHIFYPISAEN